MPCGTSRQIVKRSALAGWASYGLRRAFPLVLGLKLYLLTTAEGMPVAWCLAGPKLGERDVAAELLGHARDTGALRGQMIVLCGKGLAGREMGTLRGRSDRCPAGPPRPQGRAPRGVFSRIAQRLLAMAACIWHNWRTGASDKRSLIAYDH